VSDFLTRILKTTREDLDTRMSKVAAAELKKIAAQRLPHRKGIFRQAIAGPGMSLIAEVKRASPSKGDIRPDLTVADVVKSYEAGGASAISVLTEERHFKGSLADLAEARRATALPILRKDFIIDEYQILEAAAAGADAILLIVAALAPERLTELMEAAQTAGLDALVEVHTRPELEITLAVGAPLIGINNRDLASFEVSLKNSLDMIEFLPDDLLVVSESGIGSREDVIRLGEAGVDAVLVGEILMRSPDPQDKIRELLSG